MSHLDQLYRSLRERRRPEDVAGLVLQVIGHELSRAELRVLEKASRGALNRRIYGHTSMPRTFKMPDGLGPQVKRARHLFATAPVAEVDATDPEAIHTLITALSTEIGKTVGASDFQGDRLNGELRAYAGVDDSRRRYNRKFRLLRRMERKLAALGGQLEHRELTMIGKSGLASRISHELFTRHRASAGFIAYLVARKHLRSEFTIDGQTQAFDEVAAMLLERCNYTTPSWLAIAHVHPTREVLARLDDEQKMTLYGEWMTVMYRVGEALASVWERSRFDLRTMTVRRGDDSTTWNQLASAWNVARDGWMALTYELGLDALLERACPGKVMRLIAGDLAMMHARAGHGTEPNTQVWAELPLPWHVLRGQGQRCDVAVIERVCRRVGLDPNKSGWIAARPAAEPVPFTATPELVHGIVVSNPYLAGFLRRSGWWSGKQPRELAGGLVSAAVVAVFTGEVKESN